MVNKFFSNPEFFSLMFLLSFLFAGIIVAHLAVMDYSSKKAVFLCEKQGGNIIVKENEKVCLAGKK